MQRILIMLSLLLLSHIANAYVPTAGVIGEQVSGGFFWLGKFFSACCIAIGMYFTLSGLLKIKTHRNNPSAVPLSSGIMQLFFGGLLLALALFYAITSPYVFGEQGGKLNVFQDVLYKNGPPSTPS